jgi:predicted DNA-binding transcriptional regulator AlpA
MGADIKRVEQRWFCLAEVAHWAGVSKSSVLRWVDAGRFPARRRLGPNRVAWDRQELEEWAREREPVIPESSAPADEPPSEDPPEDGDEPSGGGA